MQEGDEAYRTGHKEEEPSANQESVEGSQVSLSDAVVEQGAVVVVADDAVVADAAVRGFGLALDIARPTMSGEVEIRFLEHSGSLLVIFFRVEDAFLIRGERQLRVVEVKPTALIVLEASLPIGRLFRLRS